MAEARTLREEAVRLLSGVEPAIRTWPRDVYVVGIPTRFRVDNFVPVTEGAATTNVQVAATATPFKSVWTFGDVTVTCAFAGKEFAGKDDDAPDACKHTFHRSTAGERRSATVQVHYHVVWGSNLFPEVRPLPDIVSVPHTFDYQVKSYEAIIR